MGTGTGTGTGMNCTRAASREVQLQQVLYEWSLALFVSMARCDRRSRVDVIVPMMSYNLNVRFTLSSGGKLRTLSGPHNVGTQIELRKVSEGGSWLYGLAHVSRC